MRKIIFKKYDNEDDAGAGKENGWFLIFLL